MVRERALKVVLVLGGLLLQGGVRGVTPTRCSANCAYSALASFRKGDDEHLGGFCEITEAANQGRKFPGCRRRATPEGNHPGPVRTTLQTPIASRIPFRLTIFSSLWSLIRTR